MPAAARGIVIRSPRPRTPPLPKGRRSLDDARDGNGRLVVVEGSAGIGKSRLLAKGRALAAAGGMRVLGARAGEHESEFAFGVVRQLFEPLLVNAAPAERAEWLAGAAALVEPLFTAAPAPAAGDSPFAIQHGLYWLAANIAYATPACLIVDDVHWADAPSLRWLGFLAHRLDGLPLTLVVASRPAAEGRDAARLDELLGDPAAVVVQPAPLALVSVLELARARLGVEPDEAFVAAVEAATGGNPLYVGAVLDSVAREGVEPTADRAEHVPDMGPRAVARTRNADRAEGDRRAGAAARRCRSSRRSRRRTVVADAEDAGPDAADRLRPRWSRRDACAYPLDRSGASAAHVSAVDGARAMGRTALGSRPSGVRGRVRPDRWAGTARAALLHAS